MIPCGEGKSKFYVSVGSAVVTPDFAGVFQPGNFRRKLLSQRLPGSHFWGEWMSRLSTQITCATNWATPCYEIFQLWSNMGSAPVFDQFPARGKTPSALASQSFPGFWRSVARTRASRSQSKRATNCATPGYPDFLRSKQKSQTARNSLYIIHDKLALCKPL